MTDRIKARIAELTTQRDQFVIQANQELAGLARAISELEALLKPDAPQETT